MVEKMFACLAVRIFPEILMSDMLRVRLLINRWIVQLQENLFFVSVFPKLPPAMGTSEISCSQLFFLRFVFNLCLVWRCNVITYKIVGRDGRYDFEMSL